MDEINDNKNLFSKCAFQWSFLNFSKSFDLPGIKFLETVWNKKKKIKFCPRFVYTQLQNRSFHYSRLDKNSCVQKWKTLVQSVKSTVCRSQTCKSVMFLSSFVFNRLPRLARYLQAVLIVTNSFGRLNKLETWNLKLWYFNFPEFPPNYSYTISKINSVLKMVR